jgi:lauroyl/myristoyl acyltransferase
VDLSADSGSQSKVTANAFAASAIRHRWPVWHAALRALGMTMRALPRSYRFPAAVFLARLLMPVVRTTKMFRERRTTVVETPMEIVLYSILNALGRAGTEFEPRVHVRGFELIETSMGSGNGVLLIGARTMLGHAFVRYLADHGYPVWLVSPDPYRLFGKRTPVPTISPGLKYFLEVREHLRKGEIVIATPDRGRARQARTLSVKTREGTVHFATPLIEVAINAKADVIFMRTWLKNDVIAIELSPSSLSGEPEANAIALQYADLVRRHVAARGSVVADGD